MKMISWLNLRNSVCTLVHQLTDGAACTFNFGVGELWRPLPEDVSDLLGCSAAS